MPQPTNVSANDLTIRVNFDMSQPQRALVEIEKAAQEKSKKSFSGMLAGMASSIPSPISQAISASIAPIVSLGAKTMGAQAQEFANAFIGKGAGQNMAQLRRGFEKYAAEDAALDRTVDTAMEFARLGIPVDGAFLSRVNDIVYTQERAAQAAGTMATNISNAKRNARDNVYESMSGDWDQYQYHKKMLKADGGSRK